MSRNALVRVIDPTPTPSFQFGGIAMRYIMIGEAPWFVGADVLRILFGDADGKANHYRKLDDSEKATVNRINLGLPPGKAMMMVAESGLYKLVMRCDKSVAKPFQTWVTRDVLPSIRKTGSYSIAKVPHQEVLPAAVQPYQLPATLSEALRAYADEVERREESERTMKLLEAAREADRPKVEFAEQYASSWGTFSFSDVARTLGFSSGKAFCQLLRDRKVIFHNVRQELVAKAEHRTAGRFVQRMGQRGGVAYVNTRITPEGVTWIAAQLPKWTKGRA